jgi:hypothetical protein
VPSPQSARNQCWQRLHKIPIHFHRNCCQFSGSEMRRREVRREGRRSMNLTEDSFPSCQKTFNPMPIPRRAVGENLIGLIKTKRVRGCSRFCWRPIKIPKIQDNLKEEVRWSGGERAGGREDGTFA